MLKSQRFASLFRHYAKHHGLDKETLVFYFTEELQNEDTPESVHMQVNTIDTHTKHKPLLSIDCRVMICFTEELQNEDTPESVHMQVIAKPALSVSSS
jgi:hypothetical protein